MHLADTETKTRSAVFGAAVLVDGMGQRLDLGERGRRRIWERERGRGRHRICERERGGEVRFAGLEENDLES